MNNNLQPKEKLITEMKARGWSIVSVEDDGSMWVDYHEAMRRIENIQRHSDDPGREAYKQAEEDAYWEALEHGEEYRISGRLNFRTLNDALEESEERGY